MPTPRLPVMPFAWQERGTHEIAGPACQVRIGLYLATVGLPSHDEIPWCSAFMNWCIQQTGRTGTGSAMARSWLTWGSAVTVPAYGEICVWSRGTDPTQGHVNFYVDTLPDGTFLCLGGNQQDSVSLAAYNPGHLLSIRWG